MTVDNVTASGERERFLCINLQSKEEHRAPLDMIQEIEARGSIPVWEHSIGSYIKTWHKIKTGVGVLYCVDGHGLAQCRIRLVRSECYPPLFVPFNQRMYHFAHYVSTMFPERFGSYWVQYMVDEQINSVNLERWMFATFIVMTVEKVWTPAVEYFKRNIIEKELEQETCCGL